jgi:hypothetical protein
VTRVVIAKIRSPAPKRRKTASRKKLVRRKSAVGKKLARRRNGRPAKVYSVDSTSKTFDGDLVHVFESNVAAARQANIAFFGSPDGPSDS